MGQTPDNQGVYSVTVSIMVVKLWTVHRILEFGRFHKLIFSLVPYTESLQSDGYSCSLDLYLFMAELNIACKLQ